MSNEPEDRFYSQAEMAELVNRSSRTLRAWEKRKLIIPNRYPSGKPFYTLEHWRQITGFLSQGNSV